VGTPTNQTILARCRRRTFSRRVVAYVLAPMWIGLLALVSILDKRRGWAELLAGHGITQNRLNLCLTLILGTIIALIIYSNLCPLCAIGFFRREGRRGSRPLTDISGVCSRCGRDFDIKSYLVKGDDKP
jgi:hypothetical protein